MFGFKHFHPFKRWDKLWRSLIVTYLLLFCWSGSGGDKDIDAEKVQIKTLEEAFQRIREATGEDDVDVIVTNFIRRENENFALFKYVNEINDEVEQLHDEIYNMQVEIKQFEKDDIKNEGVRVQMLKDLEVGLNFRMEQRIEKSFQDIIRL